MVDKDKSTYSFLMQAVYFVIIAFMLMPLPGIAAVQASIDRSVIYLGESFTLTISSDFRQNDRPDLSLLEKDFNVLGTGSSQQVQIINGTTSINRSWNITLQAKSVGQFHIPSLRVGKQLTNPIQIIVSVPPVASDATGGQHVFIETEIENADQPVYLQQQIIYTVRLLYDQQLLEGGLSDPAPENALVEQLEKNTRYKSQRKGKPYTVIERRYAIFPEKSGELIIPPLRFSGKLMSRNSGRPISRRDSSFQQFFGRDPFAGVFDQGQTVTVLSKEQRLTVLPRPANYTGKHWIPATDLKILDSWVDQPPEFRVGEPVSRNISLQAQGLLATLLPELDGGTIPGVNIYPETPVSETRSDGTQVRGISRQVLTYIPTRAGEIIIPELKITWWDTRQEKERTTVLPQWRVNVLSGKNQADVSDTAAGQSSLLEDASKEISNDAPDEFTDDSTEPGTEGRSLTGFIGSFTPAFWITVIIIVLFLFWRGMRKVRASANTKPVLVQQPPKRVLQKLQKQLKTACENNDKQATAEVILKMVAVMKPTSPVQNLPALAEMVKQGSNHLIELDRVLYAPDKQDWNGMPFYECFKNGLMFREKKQVTKYGLAPLYPE